MIVTPRILLRLVAIVFVGVLLQVGLFSGTPLLGSVPNIVPVVIVALGLLGGAVTGAVAGFAAGHPLDMMTGGPPGVAALGEPVGGPRGATRIAIPEPGGTRPAERLGDRRRLAGHPRRYRNGADGKPRYWGT